MLKITDDPARHALVLEPSGGLTRDDFAALDRRFEARAAADGGRINLVVNAPTFPGWADFSGFLAHLDFVRTHQARVEKVALVSDSRLLDAAPAVARLFVSAEIRHFPGDGLAAAQAWIAAPAAPGGFELMAGLPEDVLGISATGEITARDYAETLRPLIEARLKTRPKLRLLYRIGPEFDYTAGAVLADARLGLTHWSDFERVAIVTDVDWIARAVRLFTPLIPGEVRVFPDAGIDAAKVWVSAPAEAA
ncbi:STAS/SEC14 domain-containing protein [Amaricoccus sp.]|uniref:STAS/SEC14 domain-containing protein n=1 Tax=Amaricoccus sp. TaxID=1872485 RepID=UPI001B5F4901|nr:STAS/SEC14 domain-containing protein [Amaricoccus sp.]MBP7242893.1 STAS/SEC14 domain-containing protein [Amaricoccus sp.]